jgi:hypothetical protein
LGEGTLLDFQRLESRLSLGQVGLGALEIITAQCGLIRLEGELTMRRCPCVEKRKKKIDKEDKY